MQLNYYGATTAAKCRCADLHYRRVRFRRRGDQTNRKSGPLAGGDRCIRHRAGDTREAPARPPPLRREQRNDRSIQHIVRGHRSTSRGGHDRARGRANAFDASWTGAGSACMRLVRSCRILRAL
ncbi:Hypothetical protein BN69_3038 [Methylocystis sp. SC2]|nr:Hypothetical protein BN69_3038 [Methylocystis sp. SC2]